MAEARKKSAASTEAKPTKAPKAAKASTYPEAVGEEAMKDAVAAVQKVALEHGLSNLQARELFRTILRVSRKQADGFIWQFTFGR